MPTYEYRCGACGHDFERFQKMSEPPIRECPECGEAAVERLISPGAGLVFKGPGFYATDYRDGGGGKEKSGEEGSEGSTEEDGGATGVGSGGDGGDDDGD